MRFPRHDGIYRSDVSFLLFTPGAGPAFRSGRCQGIGHAGKHMPFPSSAMSSGRLFLDRVARQQSPSPLRRQGHRKTLDRRAQTNYHRTETCGLTGCLTPGVHPNRCLAVYASCLSEAVSGNVENQYLLGSASPLGHSISNHSAACGSARQVSRCAGRTRTAANRDRRFFFTPSRQVIYFQAIAGSSCARCLTVTG